MASQSRDAAIVGIHEFPSRDVEGELSPLHIKAESAARALEDAGLTWSDVDAIYDAAEGGASGLSISEYFGIKPKVIDTTNVGGSSYQFHAAHARRDIADSHALAWRRIWCVHHAGKVEIIRDRVEQIGVVHEQVDVVAAVLSIGSANGGEVGIADVIRKHRNQVCLG